MNDQAAIGMPRGSLLRIDDGAGVLLCIREGEIWLTEEGSPRDHMLQSGQWYRVKRGGGTLLHAFRGSNVVLSSPRLEHSARRIALTRPGSAVPLVLYQRQSASLTSVLRWFRAQVIEPLLRKGAGIG